jgi:hypothetical protein
VPVVGPRRFLRALAASWALAGGLALVPVPAPADAVPAAVPSAVPKDDSPLRVTIGSLTPGSLPATGDITVTGTVTNRTDETWRDVSVYAVDGTTIGGVAVEPMRTPGDLRRAMTTPYDQVVGDRVLLDSAIDKLGELAPRASAGYTVVVPVASVEVDRAGVYWFGVHALGVSDSVPYDQVADGRARTFLPQVPARFDSTPLPLAVVVPLTRSVRYASDGSVDGEQAWTRDLTDGRLARVLDLVDESPGPVTWLVDPALVDAVAHLAAGNRPRSLGASVADDDEPSAEPSGDEEATGDSEAARAAARWLERLDTALDGDEVLTLPYGDVDVAATLARDPELLTLALAQRSDALEDLGVETRPVIASPNGYLDAASVRAADPGTRVLVNDRMLGADAPVVADADGHRLVVTSYGVSQGGPGPGRSLTAVGIRQRVLAEAALRAVRSDREPLVAVLPSGWDLDDAASFWDGLDTPWVDLEPLSDVEAATTPAKVSPDDLDYPDWQAARELGRTTVDGVADLVEAGDTLQNLLVDNTGVAGTVTEEALTGLSYHVRDDQVAGRSATARSRDWVADRLGDVEIDAPNGVTLASDQGTFVVTLTNTLDHRVAVSVRSRSDAGIEVTAPERVVLAPGARETVRLKTRTSTSSVHNVELMVTDRSGTPLGSTSELRIRSTQVGGVIWVIIGIGAAILFLAIAVRLGRRVAAARRGEPGAGRRRPPKRGPKARSHAIEGT